MRKLGSASCRERAVVRRPPDDVGANEHSGKIAVARALVALAVAVAPLRARADDLEVVVPGVAAVGWKTSTSTDDARRDVRDVAGLVEASPGVHVRRLGGDDSFATLSIRGAASSEVGVVLAGIPLTGAADPSLDLGSLPLWPGAQVRVLRSFAPATIGTSGYLGGVLVLDPPSIARGARTEVWAAAGSFGGRKLRIADVRRVGALSFASAVSASRSDGDFAYFDDDPQLVGDAMRARKNNGHVAVSAVERAELEAPWGTLGVTLLGQAREQGLAGPARYPTTVSRLDTSRLGAAADARLRTGDPEAEGGVGVGALRFAAFGVRERSSFRDPLGEIDPSRAGARTEDTIDVAGGSASWRGLLSRAVLGDVVLDARRERFSPGASDVVVVSPPSHRDALGVGGDLEVHPTSPLALAATVRADYRHDATDGGATSSDLAPTGHVGADLRLADALSLAAHGGYLARAPSFTELYGDRGALLGNAALAPERAFTVDAGARGRGKTSGLGVRYEAVGFYTVARDLIAFVPYGRSSLRAGNLDRAELLGVELELALRAGAATTTLVYTGLATRNDGDDALARGKPLPGRPAHDFAADTQYAIGPARLRYGLDVVAGTTVDPRATIVLPVRVLHHAGASVEVPGARGLTLGVQVDNLFDLRVAYVASPASGHAIAEPVSDLLGYPLPGRTVWLSAKWSYKP